MPLPQPAPGAAPRPRYNESEAVLHYHYALASFCEGDVIRRWDCGVHCDAAPVVPGSPRYLPIAGFFHVQGYVARLPERGDEPGPGVARRCVAGFRGSQPMNPGNIAADFLFAFAPWPDGGASWCPGCMAHQGFAGAYADIRPALLDALRELRCRSVTLAGHSLGGALATLASAELRAGLNFSVDAVWSCIPSRGSLDMSHWRSTTPWRTPRPSGFASHRRARSRARAACWGRRSWSGPTQTT